MPAETIVTHTAGPWGVPYEALDTQTDRIIVVTDTPYPLAVCEMTAEACDSEAQLLANARLISASPTMYAYLAELASGGDTKAASIIEAIHAGRS